MAFSHFLKKLNLLKKLEDPATKSGTDATYTASIRVVQKTAEVTRD